MRPGRTLIPVGALHPFRPGQDDLFIGCQLAAGTVGALVHIMREAGLSVAQQKGITVYYAGIIVGEYVADLVVEGTVVVELKASKSLDPVHTAQCINYLKATGLHLCLLLNFGRPRLEIHRIAHEL